MILAPVARDRKGEFVDVFAEMQAQGYVRFRVDGQAVRVRRPAQAEEGREARHRRGDRPAQGARRTSSSGWPKASRPRCAWPTAARSPWRWTAAREHLFNAKFACPICNYSISELEPRLFSFNSPVGACPSCDGLGHMEFFDPARVVAFPDAVAGQRRDQGLGPPQRLLLRVARKPGQALQVQPRRALRGTRAGRPARRSCTARARRKSASATRSTPAPRRAAR